MVSAALPDTLTTIRAKILSGERLDLGDAVKLLEHDDVLELGELADIARLQRGGTDEVSYGTTEASCSLVYTAGESAAVRAERLLEIRNRQDDTASAEVFAPLPASADATTGQDDISMVAVSRLVLDNIPHLQVCADLITAPLAQVALAFGADDLNVAPEDDPELLIGDAGRVPVRGWQ